MPFITHLGLGLGHGSRYKLLTATRGPEIAPDVTGTGWTLNGTTPPTQNGTGIHFNAASSGGTAVHSIASEDNATYEIIYTISNYVAGGCRIQLYGATTAHLAQTTTRQAAGTFTEQVTTNAAGSLSLVVRVNCTGASNTYDVPSLSIKKVLA